MQRVIIGFAASRITLVANAQTAPAPAADKAPSADAVIGHYRFESGLIMTVEKNGSSLAMTSTGQPTQMLLALADGRFSYANGQAQLSFDLDKAGKAKTLHVHFDGESLPADRVDEAAVKKVSDALALKIKDQTHDPACAKTLKRLIEELRAGKPDYSKMTLGLRQATRMQLPMIQTRFQELGAVKEVKFLNVGPTGTEQFDVTFENGATQWRIFCLPNGYVSAVGFR